MIGRHTNITDIIASLSQEHKAEKFWVPARMGLRRAPLNRGAILF